MVAELRRRSEEFAALWDTHDVALRRTDHKRIVHATLGVVELDCHNLFSEDGRQRLLWFSAPPGTEAPPNWSCSPSSAPRTSSTPHPDTDTPSAEWGDPTHRDGVPSAASATHRPLNGPKPPASGRPQAL